MLDTPVPLLIQNYIGPPDSRLKNWILTDSPKWFLTTLVFYSGFVYFGNKFMSKRKPFSLKTLMVVFNVFQVCFSFYIFKEVLVSAAKMNYSIICQPLNFSYNSESLRMVTAFWYFYLSKFIDLMDTIFLVLKKKKNQLSFLHLYHHSSMLFNWYVGVLYCPGGQAFLSVLANCSVHVIMYSYYLLAALGPQMQKYLWWKKYLTQMQLVQFFIIIGHLFFGLFTNCNQPRWLAVFTITYLLTLVFLFVNFYYKSYSKSIPTSDRKRRLIFTLPSAPLEIYRVQDYNAGGDKKIL